MKNKFKNKFLWVSIASLILLILSNSGILNKIGISEMSVKIITDSILSILVLLGILNNPDEKK